MQERRINPLGTKGALIHPYGHVRSAEGLSSHREISPRSDMAALPQQGAAPLAPLRGYGDSEGRKKEYHITAQGKEIAEKELARLNELVSIASEIIGGAV